MSKDKKNKAPSRHADKFAARIAAAQAVYQHLHSGRSLPSIVEEFRGHRKMVEIDGADPVQPNFALMEKIALGVAARKEDLENIVKAHFKKEGREADMLLRAILLAGACELLGNTGTDAAVVINEYVDVTHAFYGAGEAGLVNGILDAVSKTLK